MPVRTRQIRTRRSVLAAGGLMLAGALGLWPRTPDLRATPVMALVPLQGPVPVYHLGHSLVGRDMPAMLAQLAGHPYNSQLGWGASLMNHWVGDVPGFAEENRPPAFRPAGPALDSGDYPVVVLTEMVELRDAIRWHDSAGHLALWSSRVRAARPDARVYLFETWHRLDDPDGWLTRIDEDLPRLWEAGLLAPASETAGPIHVIPGGQVLAAVSRRAEAGQIPGLTCREDLFAAQDGGTDPIHLNDIGSYLMALTHFAVIYGRSPLGLPHRLRRADGRAALAPSPETARAMQQVVWQVVTGYDLTGVARVG